MSLSKKDNDFIEAMALNLRINRQVCAEEQRLREEYGDFRYELARSCFSRAKADGTATPNLTIASVLKHMDTWGF